MHASPAPRSPEWIVAQRPPRHHVDPFLPHAFLSEQERQPDHSMATVATVFLTNRECPFRCLMCDLWKNTLTEPVPPGALPAQVDFALSRLPGPPPRVIKLYNSGSFFDPGAVPISDYPALADRAARFSRVIVECHPAFVGGRALEFRDLLRARNPSAHLEVAIGLETVHPDVLPRLQKRMTLDQFQVAARVLREHEIDLRVFVLVKPPYLDDLEAIEWAGRSIDFAFDCGATAVSLIPTRLGNGALEALVEAGEFSPPRLSTLEAALEFGIGLGRGRVFADLWDLEKFSTCGNCFPARKERLEKMNLQQIIPPRARCHCA